MLYFGAELMEDARVEVSLGIVFPELLIVVCSVDTVGAVGEERCLLGPFILQPGHLLVHICGGRGACSQLLKIEILKVATISLSLFICDDYRALIT